MADHKFREKGGRGNILQDTEKVLNLVLVPVCYKVLDAIRVVDPSMTCHEGHYITCENSLRTEGYVQMQCGRQIVRGGECCFGKGILANLWAQTDCLDQHGWGEPVRVVTRKG